MPKPQWRVNEAGRRKREEERRQRDAEKARKRREARMKLREKVVQQKAMRDINADPSTENEDEVEKRKKILGYRRIRAQTIVDDTKNNDDENDNSNENVSNEAQNEQQLSATSATASNTENEAANANTNESETQNENDADDNHEAGDTVAPSMTRQYTYVVNDGMIEMDDENETILFALEQAFTIRDPEFYGFVHKSVFCEAFEASERPIDLTTEEMDLLFRRSLIPGDDAIDYYGFIGSVRIQALTDQTPVIDVLRNLALQQQSSEAMRDASDESGDDDDNDTYNGSDMPPLTPTKRPPRARDRKRHESVASMVSFTSVRNLDPANPLTQLISDLALDDAEVDIALINIAFQMIDVEPIEEDLQCIFDYLDTKNTGWIDFRYFFQFIQEASKQNPSDFNLKEVISEVAANLRVFIRQEKRRAEQDAKLKKRLNKRLSRNIRPVDYRHSQEMQELTREEKRLSKLNLRDKANLYR